MGNPWANMGSLMGSF